MLQPSLNELIWRFDLISSGEPERASALAMAGTPTALLNALESALAVAIAGGEARFGQEQSPARPDDCRAVVQFHVGVKLFDWFFNARTGYRAHFRVQCESGLRFNGQIIEVLRLRLDRSLPEVVFGRQLNGCFEDCGQAEISKAFLMDSLTLDQSKVWFCTRLIGRSGGVQDLPLGVLGPRILLDNDEEWPAFYREHEDAWLEIKGAYLGTGVPYLLKDPRTRAQEIHATGTT
jgi:hypothetical protein